MVFVWVLALIDVHTLIVLLFSDFMSPLYIFSGSTFALFKGLIFYLPNRDLFSLLDIVTGFLMLFLLIGHLYGIIWWSLFSYLMYKIIMSFGIIK